MIFSSRHRQEFISLVKPHLPLLQSKARHWTSSPAQADLLLDGLLQRMAGNLEGLRRSDNLRLLLVRELFEDYLQGREDLDEEQRQLLDKDGILANFLAARQDRMKSRDA